MLQRSALAVVLAIAATAVLSLSLYGPRVTLLDRAGGPSRQVPDDLSGFPRGSVALASHNDDPVCGTPQECSITTTVLAGALVKHFKGTSTLVEPISTTTTTWHIVAQYASPPSQQIDECSCDDATYTLDVGVSYDQAANQWKARNCVSTGSGGTVVTSTLCTSFAAPFVGLDVPAAWSCVSGGAGNSSEYYLRVAIQKAAIDVCSVNPAVQPQQVYFPHEIFFRADPIAGSASPVTGDPSCSQSQDVYSSVRRSTPIRSDKGPYECAGASNLGAIPLFRLRYR